ncbi:MAG: T9SS type A sorting domain-containing protein [Chitinophagaceae bacterium]
MKTVILAFTISLLFTGAQAQITLEKSYNQNLNMQVIKLENEGYKYIGFDSSKSKVHFYNTDHSLWKDIPINPPAGYTVFPIFNFAASEHLFNSDDKVEILITFSASVLGSNYYKLVLLDENGTLIQTFDDCYYGFPVKINSSWKLLVTNADYYTVGGNGALHTYSSVYSLPGQYISQLKVPQSGREGNTSLYPNPLSEQATLHYNLPSGINQAKANIFNSNGALIRTYNITNQFSELLIQRGDLPAGIYTYSVTTVGYSSSSSSFVIQ